MLTSAAHVIKLEQYRIKHTNLKIFGIGECTERKLSSHEQWAESSSKNGKLQEWMTMLWLFFGKWFNVFKSVVMVIQVLKIFSSDVLYLFNRERNLPIIDSFPQWPQQLGLDKTKARNQKSLLGLPRENRVQAIGWSSTSRQLAAEWEVEQPGC